MSECKCFVDAFNLACPVHGMGLPDPAPSVAAKPAGQSFEVVRKRRRHNQRSIAGERARSQGETVES